MGVLYLASSSSRRDLWFILQSWVGWNCLVLAEPRSHSLTSLSSVRSKFSSLISLEVGEVSYNRVSTQYLCMTGVCRVWR